MQSPLKSTKITKAFRYIALCAWLISPAVFSMTLYVNRAPEPTLTLDVEPSDTIEGIKAKIQDSIGLDPARQILSFPSNNPLDDGRTLSDYNIQKESTIFLTLFNADVTPLADDTRNSLASNARALRHAFNLQSAKIAQGLSLDCRTYDQKNMCASIVSTRVDGHGLDAAQGILIIAHRPADHVRFGGYIDQSYGSSASGGLTTVRGRPGFGVFGVWSPGSGGSGVQVRMAANMGGIDIQTAREALASAEAGWGESRITSKGIQLEVSRDQAINARWSVRPYVGYRISTNKRAGYTERASDEVSAPLTYRPLGQNIHTLTAGAAFAHSLSANTSLLLRAGIEHDLKHHIGRYEAANEAIGAIAPIDMHTDTRRSRATAAFTLTHRLDHAQLIGLSVNYRQEAFEGASHLLTLAQYAKGF